MPPDARGGLAGRPSAPADRHRAGELLADEVAIELVVGRPGDGRTHDDARGHHVQRQLPAERREQLIGLQPAIGRARHEHDPLAEPLVVDAEGDCVADQPGRVSDLLDLGRADPVARGLDHLVLAADEVEEALLVALDQVAGEDRGLGRAARRASGLGGRPEARRGALGIVPVAHRDQGAAMDELADLAGVALAHRPRAPRGSRRSGSPCRSSPGERRPARDRGRWSGRPRSARTSGTGLASGKIARSRSSVAAASARRCWRSSAGAAVASVGPALVDELVPQRRDAGQSGDPVLARRAGPRPGQQVVDQHDVGADRERGRQLAEARVEAQRQDREDAVVARRSRGTG